jgi:hypothetical protein
MMFSSSGQSVKYKLKNIVAQRQKPVNPAPKSANYMENPARMC